MWTFGKWGIPVPLNSTVYALVFRKFEFKETIQEVSHTVNLASQVLTICKHLEASCASWKLHKADHLPVESELTAWAITQDKFNPEHSY